MTAGPDDVQKAYRAIGALIVVVLVAATSTVAVRWAYGAFSDDITVTGTFERAGQALNPGSDVKYRGVNVGKVRSVRLKDRRVEVTLRLHRNAPVPAASSATVRTKTLFGEKYVELAPPPGRDSRPYFRDGDRLAATGTGTEVETLLDDLDGLLRGVDAEELATLVDEVARGSAGEGKHVAHLLDRGVAASTVIADTVDAQVRALESLQRFTRQYRDVGPRINAIGANLNEVLPTFNAARADYERFLVSLKPFADHLAEFLDVNQANLDRILDNGDNIVRVLTANEANISATIQGLGRYTSTFSGAFGNDRLPDGSRFGYLKLFMDAGSLNALICRSLGPTGTLPQLNDIRAELARVAPVLACDPDDPVGAQGATDPVAELTDGLTGAVATPDRAQPTGTAGDVVTSALGGGT